MLTGVCIMSSRQELTCRIALLSDKIRSDEQELKEDKELLLSLKIELSGLTLLENATTLINIRNNRGGYQPLTRNTDSWGSE